MCESVPFCLYPAGTPEAHLLPMAARIREASGLPVIVAGRIRSPSVARLALDAGQADLIGLGRPFLSDPDWVQKAEDGDEDSILLCAACHQGCLGELRKGAGTHCLINPLTGRESEVVLEKADAPRRVIVVGGGPAGLEAAQVAAARGHRVTLFEEKVTLGGQLALAAQVPHKEGFGDVIRQLVSMAKRSGAEIRLGTRVTAEDLLSDHPEVVILATGAVPISGAFPGMEEIPWELAEDILEGGAEVEGSTVLLVGGGLVGLEAADFLSARGKKVVLVEMEEEVGAKLDLLPRTMLLKRLTKQGVEIHTGTTVERISQGQVVAAKGGEEIRFTADTAVLAVGFRPNRELADSLMGSDLELHLIGDAIEPRGVGEAIWEGFDVAAKLR
jgi:NADPH-dependent 2,4-dienoyl-CoA reductase/sulfur reductase-like enzyme